MNLFKGFNMNMKNLLQKILVLALFFAFVQFLANAQSSALSNANGALSLSNIGISNQPVVAGNNISVTFQLFNSYSQELTNVNIYLEAQNPLINISPSSSYLINAIGEGLYGGSSFNHFIYKFHIPSTIQPGEYVINVIATYETSNNNGVTNVVGSSEMPITLYVYGNPDINVSASSIILLPDQNIPITLDIANIGTDIARNVTVKLLNSSIFNVVNSNEYALGTVAQQQTEPVQFTVQTNNNITNSTYFLNLQVNYTTQYNANKSKIIKIPLHLVVNSPNIVASISSADPSQVFSGSNQSLNVNFQNIGLGEAKNISIKFLSTNSITLGNPSAFFIAQLMPDNIDQAQSQEIESIFVQINNQSALNYTIPVIVNYTNANYRSSITKKFLLNVSLEPKAVFNILSINDSIVPGQSYAPITMQVKNTGNEPAQHISFTLQTIYPISPVNTNQYVSQLNPGQTKNITFYVSADTNGNPGNYPVTLYEQWTQQNTPQNQQLSSSNNYYAVVKQTQKPSSSSSNELIKYIAIGVIAIGIIAFALNKRKALKKQELKHKK